MNTRVTTKLKTQQPEEKYAQRTFMKYSSSEIAKDAPGETVLLNGNEALARGCIEAGVRVGACFPGSPVTYTMDNLVEAAHTFPSMHVEWSVNEKVAYEIALGAAMTGVRAMCVFKNIGLEVALDAVATSSVELGPGGLVLVINDDPDKGATQTECDIRYLAMYSSIPVLEPASMQEVKDFTAAAFELSEKLHVPVLVRPMYSQAYARERVVLGDIRHDIRERTPRYDVREWHAPRESGSTHLHASPPNWAHLRYHGEVPPPQTANKGWPNEKEIIEAAEAFAGNKLAMSEKAKLGIISSGMAYRETMETLKGLGISPDEVSILKLGITYPLPQSLVKTILEQSETVLVIEEIEPVIEDQVRTLSSEMDKHAKILGKRTSHIPYTSERKRSQLAPVLAGLLGKELQDTSAAQRQEVIQEVLANLPGYREGTSQCPGCPGPASAYALKNVSEQLGIAVHMQYFGYDGCCGGIPRGEAGHVICMGAGVNVAAGMYHAGLKGKQVTLCGDSNFFHAWMPGLVEAVYNKSDILFYVMDNRTTAMTGHQPHPGGFGITAVGEETKTLDIAEIAKAFQCDYVATVDPYDQEETFEAVKQALLTKGVSVVVALRTCAVVAQRQKGARDALIFDRKSQIDRTKCLSWNVEMSPCEAKCPINQDVEGYVKAIADNNYKKALEIIRETNPFPGICGRVCTHVCETACKRGKLDEPVDIRGLKRFAADWELANGREKATPFARTKAEEIAIIGAGPAGLTAGLDLVRQGYGVSVFEASATPGGMLVNGIPEFVLPREIVRNEIGYIEDAGVKIKTGVALGRDISIADLQKQGFKAIFLAIGSQKGRAMGVPGEDLSGVTTAMDFLRQSSVDKGASVGQRVVVVGGGFTAVDAARAAKRMGAKEVTVVYRRSRAEMPATGRDVSEAENEGVSYQFLVAPVRVIGEGGRVSGIECQRMRLGPAGEDGRRSFEPIPDTNFVIPADSVISAVGQAVEIEVIAASDVASGRQGTITADPITLATNRPGIFAGGDAVIGAGTVVEAIAAGHRAAVSIDRYIKGEDIHEGRVTKPPFTGADIMPEGILKTVRQEMPTLQVAERLQSFVEVDTGLTEDQAIMEAWRCLRCKRCRKCIDDFACMAIIPEHGHPTIDQDNCAGCNVCIQVCPYGNIQEVEESK